ncbi:hypothetical protein [Curtobacterium sp. USHLN213]|uniref:hypothetical protein n=1 Tax=Curtobacterium sp. USHLN213 TaxID=3081255 RepID=UPI003016C8C6
MTAFFAPEDLRVVDPRPTAQVREPDVRIVRELLATRLTGDDLTLTLQALGLEPYETHRVPERAYADGDVCRNGHSRREHSFVDPKGWSYCRKCRSIRAEKKRAVTS